MSISIQNLTKKYGDQKAVDGISFEINTGEIVGFIGPNGAGKSTTMKVITGFLSEFEGDVFVNDLNVKENDIEVKKIIGYLPEHNPLYTDMFVKEYLLFVANIFKIEQAKIKVQEIIKRTGLEKEQSKKINALSKGYKQRVGLAAVLIHDPEVLILDEPTTGLDPNQIVEIRNLIASVGKKKTVLLSTHIMQEVEAICNRVIIINEGQIVANDISETIKHNAQTSQATILVEFLQNCTVELLQQIPEIEDVVALKNNQWLLKPSTSKDIREDIFNFAVANKLTVLSMQLQEKSLEQAFQDLTKKS